MSLVSALPEKFDNPVSRLWYDKPTLGLLLVREKNRVLVEYALGGNTKPISVAEWDTRLTHALPEELQASLPTIEQIEAELARVRFQGRTSLVAWRREPIESKERVPDLAPALRGGWRIPENCTRGVRAGLPSVAWRRAASQQVS